MELLNGKSISVRPSERYQVADIRIRKCRGYPAGLAEGTFDIILACFRACDTEGALFLPRSGLKLSPVVPLAHSPCFLLRRSVRL